MLIKSILLRIHLFPYLFRRQKYKKVYCHQTMTLFN
nr:MAG TPA: hypothetical protein [Caudoviricetes sp.]